MATRLRRVGLIRGFIKGIGVGIFCLIVGLLLIWVPPVAAILFLAAGLAPFVCPIFSMRDFRFRCPFCGVTVETGRQRVGRGRCRSCRTEFVLDGTFARSTE